MRPRRPASTSSRVERTVAVCLPHQAPTRLAIYGSRILSVDSLTVRVETCDDTEEQSCERSWTYSSPKD